MANHHPVNEHDKRHFHHSHGHRHEDSHHHAGHHHHGSLSHIGKAFVWGIVLNIAFVAVEAAAGFITGSLSLLSDAGHNLSDVVGLLSAGLAFKLSFVKPNRTYSYGYKRSTIMASLFNAIILLLAVGMILIESVQKLLNPTPLSGEVIAWVAGVGIIINGITAYLFYHDRKEDLNIRGAFLHMTADTLVSVGVVASGILIHFTGWNILDPVIGIAIALIILFSTMGLLKESFRLSLDGIPQGIDVQEVEKLLLDIPQVLSIHHLHIWAISTTENALTVHVVVRNFESAEAVKHEIRHWLEKINIHHATLEFETKEEHCNELSC